MTSDQSAERAQSSVGQPGEATKLEPLTDTPASSGSDFYTELITPPDSKELSQADLEAAGIIAKLSLEGIERALSAGLITNVEVSFEIVDPDGHNAGFNFSSFKEE